MILPGETEAGSAGMQPCRGIAWWAHRDDDQERGNQLLALRLPIIGSKDPDALKIPARRAEFTLTESASSPFHAEPEQNNLFHGGKWPDPVGFVEEVARNTVLIQESLAVLKAILELPNVENVAQHFKPE
jgi:hypothetical protein